MNIYHKTTHFISYLQGGCFVNASVHIAICAIESPFIVSHRGITFSLTLFGCCCSNMEKKWQRIDNGIEQKKSIFFPVRKRLDSLC